MVTRRYRTRISDAELRDLIAKGNSSSRDLLWISHEDGYGETKHTDFYVLQGSPPKGYAIRSGRKISVHDGTGKRKAIYELENCVAPVKHEISRHFKAVPK